MAKMGDATIKIECEEAVQELAGIAERLEAVCDRLDVHRKEGTIGVVINTHGIADPNTGQRVAHAMEQARTAVYERPGGEGGDSE